MVLLGLAGLLLLALIVVWTQRKPIAEGFINRELERSGVEGSYEIADLGVNRQRITDLVIGDPDDPDLTAEWAEIRIRHRFGTPQVVAVIAQGVRLRGELVDGELRFGQLDRLLPEPTGEPIKLPELDVTLRDARIDLATPYGRVFAAIEGSGPLHDGFSGRASALAPVFAVQGCRARQVRASVAIAIDQRRPAFEGPVRAAGFSCPDQALAIEAPQLALDAIFSEGFDRWGGEAGLRFASFSQGANRIARGRGRIDFDGSAEQTRGTLSLDSERVRLAGLAADRGSVSGFYRILDGGARIGLDGDIRVGDARLDRAIFADATDSLRAAEGTPIGPAGEKLAA
ncbi:MAG: exoprotein, partial [Sphingomonadales bacterium]|nr:exoprotein [Sphingomonadales bacterium]